MLKLISKLILITLFVTLVTTSSWATDELLYIDGQVLSDNVLTSIVDVSNWNVDEAVIKGIKIATSSTNWDLTIYCDSNQSSGMFASINLVTGASGNLDITLDLPYKDNDGQKKIHFLFNDAGGTNTATCDVYGVKGR